MADETIEWNVTADIMVLAQVAMTSEWLAWPEEIAADYFENVRNILKTGVVLRQRLDEGYDKLQSVGKFQDVKRLRKARGSDEDEVKVDPLAAALAAFSS